LTSADPVRPIACNTSVADAAQSADALRAGSGISGSGGHNAVWASPTRIG